MATYQAPLNDMRFILNDVFEAETFWKNNEKLADLDMVTADAILEEMAKFASNVLQPLDRTGDEEGAKFLGDGKVQTPAGFKDAFNQYAQGGWVSLGGDVDYGGQGMPKMLTMLAEEMLFSTNQSFTLYPNLTTGACLALNAHANEAQKQQYIPKMYSGEWSGTMCLTEPHAGTDLGIIKTKAVPNDDGSYAISGTKIFITAGEHDLTENIIHLVLAKTPDAPAGSKGISLFVVPKFLINEDGSLGERNPLAAGSIEHKMGIKASATCVMNFDGAKGWLVGEENNGLAAMFVMMNYERLTMGLQGLGASEMAYQHATAYTLERVQGRSPTGVVSPEKSADAIIHHPDIRRMLLNVKANSEAARCFAMYVARQLDIAKFSTDADAKKVAAERVALLTPVAKAFLTDMSFNACVDAQQCFGGHGYIREWGMEQLVRDTRIAQIYEGTNGIQALDLMGRKVAKNGGKFVNDYLAEIREFANGMNADASSDKTFMKEALQQSADKLESLTNALLAKFGDDINEINAACVDYLHAFGFASYTYMFALMLEAANGKTGEFYTNKTKLAKFFVARILPRLDAHVAMALGGADKLMDFDMAYFEQSA